MTLVKKVCQEQERCRIDVTREFFGNSECPGTDDASMKFWLVEGLTKLTSILLIVGVEDALIPARDII